jgi:hypothetical protein
MKRQVMQPFRAPRQHKEKASPSRQQKEKPFRAPLIIKETQYSDIDEMIEKDSNGRNGNGKRFSIVARGRRSAVALAKEAGSVSSVASPCRSESQSHSTTTIPSPNIKEFEDFLDNAFGVAHITANFTDFQSRKAQKNVHERSILGRCLGKRKAAIVDGQQQYSYTCGRDDGWSWQ